MPIFVPDDFPAISGLAAKNICIYPKNRAEDLKRAGFPSPLRILFLNLMPEKQTYELQMLRLLAPCPLPVEVIPMRTETHISSHGEEDHIRRYYLGLSSLKSEHFDGLIITGAPVELLPFEEVDYWPELCSIMEWAKSHVTSSLFLCYGALAGLYYHFGIEKETLKGKRIGAFEHRVPEETGLLSGCNDPILSPHTRETGCPEKEIRTEKGLKILAESPEAGPLLMSAHGGREIFLFGHPEYDPETVCREYARDLKNGLSVLEPTHLPKSGDPSSMPLKWRADGTVLYTNWLSRIASKGTAWDFHSILRKEQ